MPTISQLMVKIGADTKDAESGIDRVKGKMSGLGPVAGAAGAVAKAGLVALTAGAAAAAGGFVLAEKTAMSYEGAMNMLEAVTGASSQEMALLGQKAKALGADLELPNTSATDAATAMLELSKAGLSVDDTLGAAKGTLQLSAAANVSNARAAEINANALNTFGLAGERATAVADLFAAAANASSVELEDVADSVAMAGSIFSSLQGPVVGSEKALVDLTVAIGVLGNMGMKGSDAGTSLKQSLLQLAAPSDKAKGLMQELAARVGEGGDIAFTASGKMRSLPEILDITARATADMTEEQRAYTIATIFGADATRSILPLIQAGPEAWARMEAAVTRGGAAADLAAARTKGLGGAFQALQSSAETALLEVGEPFLGFLENLVRGAAEGVTQLPALGRAAWTELQGRVGGALQTVQDRLADTGAAWAPWAAKAGPAGRLVGDTLSGVTGLAQSLAFLLQGNFQAAGSTAQGALKNFASAGDIAREAASSLWDNTLKLASAWTGAFRAGAGLALSVLQPLVGSTLAAAGAAREHAGTLTTVGGIALAVLAPGILAAAGAWAVHNVQAGTAGAVLVGKTLVGIVQTSAAFYGNAVAATVATGATLAHAAASTVAYVKAFGLIPVLGLGIGMFARWAAAAASSAAATVASWAVAAWPITAVIAVVGLLAVAWHTNFLGMRDRLAEFAGFVGDRLMDVVNALAGLGRAVGLPVDDWIADFNRLKDSAGQFKDAVGGALQETATQGSNAIDGMRRLVSGDFAGMDTDALGSMRSLQMQVPASFERIGADSTAAASDMRRDVDAESVAMYRKQIADAEKAGQEVPEKWRLMASQSAVAAQDMRSGVEKASAPMYEDAIARAEAMGWEVPESWRQAAEGAKESAGQQAGVSREMAQSYQDLIDDAERMGLEVPESFRQMTREANQASGNLVSQSTTDFLTWAQNMKVSAGKAGTDTVAELTRAKTDGSAQLDELKASADTTMGAMSQSMTTQAQQGADGTVAAVSGVVADVEGMRVAGRAAGASLGASIGDGLVEGLQSRIPAVREKAAAMAAAARVAAGDAVGEGSPAREFIVLGENMTAGLELGLLSGIPEVKAAARTVMDEVLDEMGRFTRSIDSLSRETEARFIQIGERAGDAINKALVETDQAIKEAQRNAVDALEELKASRDLDLTIRVRREGLAADLDKDARRKAREWEDEETAYRLMRDLERAKTAEEKAEIRKRAEYAAQDLQFRRDMEEKQRIFRAEQEEKRRILEDKLDQEAYDRQRKRIDEDAQHRIDSLNKALAEKQKEIQDDAERERKDLLTSYAQRVADLREQFVERLPEALGPAEAIVNGFLDRIAAKTSSTAQELADLVGLAWGESGNGGASSEPTPDSGSHAALTAEGTEYTIDKPYGEMSEAEQDDANRYARTRLASGGVALDETPALIGDGGEAEAVVPLSKWPALVAASGGGASFDYDQMADALVRALEARPPRVAVDDIRRVWQVHELRNGGRGLGGVSS